jgi:hypothetical protein
MVSVVSPVKDVSAPVGYTIVETLDPMYWRSGDSKNGIKNPVIYMNISEYKAPNMNIK